MPDKKMTDNEKTKALECCIEGDCDNCPYDEQTACNEYMKQDCLDLINRQKAENNELQDLIVKYNGDFAKQEAEIERLKEEKSKLENKIDEIYPLVMQLPNAMQQAKAEAYKECIEKAKKELSLIRRECRNALDNDGVFAIDRARKKVDNLLKEMVGEE